MAVYDGQRNAGNIDYCAAWYLKAARFSLYKPIDGGNYLFTDEEREKFLEREPGLSASSTYGSGPRSSSTATTCV